MILISGIISIETVNSISLPSSNFFKSTSGVKTGRKSFSLSKSLTLSRSKSSRASLIALPLYFFSIIGNGTLPALKPAMLTFLEISCNFFSTAELKSFALIVMLYSRLKPSDLVSLIFICFISFQKSTLSKMVRIKRLELLQLSPLEPKSSVSTNSTISADYTNKVCGQV